MSVPNYANVPQVLFNTGLYNLKTHAGQAAFVDAVVSTLHGLDARFGHLKKKPGQTAVHGHGEDATLYLDDEPGQSHAVDFVGGAGGPNPQPAWQVDAPRYSASDWLDPTEHGTVAAPPVLTIPSYEAIGGDAFYRARVGVPLAMDMATVGQPLNDGSSVWFSRTIYDVLAAFIHAQGAPVDLTEIVRRHRNEWRVILGLPPV